MAGLVTYPLQLRPGVWVTLLLPSDLTRAEVERLAYLLRHIALPDDADKTPPRR